MNRECYCLGVSLHHLAEGSLEVKLPTIWTHGKAEVGRVREGKGRRKEIRKRKSQKKVDAQCMCTQGRKSRNTVFFPMLWGPRGSKSILAKAAGAEPEPSGGMRHEKLHAIVARSRF